MKIFIINGFPKSGKTTLINLLRNNQNFFRVENYSSITLAKECAREYFGWDGITKDDNTRLLLSNLKLLMQSYSDRITQDTLEAIEYYLKEEYENEEIILFIDVREPYEIIHLKKEVEKKFSNIKVYTLLVTRNEAEIITSNDSDASVLDYEYDYEINNNSTLLSLFINGMILLNKVTGGF